MAFKITLLNQKGGVGKTTTTVNLGSALAAKGHKVLLIDFDAQCNLTHFVSANPNKPNIYQVLTGEWRCKNAVQKTVFKNLSVIPGSLDMAGIGVELISADNREFVLKKAISTLDTDFDYILLDCPPSLGLETMNALVWCDFVIIPLQCEYLAMEGLNLIMRTITNIKRQLNPNIKILGIVFTMFAKTIKLNKEVVKDINDFFPDLVFKTVIPRNTKIAESPSFGLPINYYEKNSKGAKSFSELAEEVSRRANR